MAHRQTQNGVERGGLGQVGNEEGGGNYPRTFRVEFTVKSGPIPCPVKGCSGRAATSEAMQVHFCHWHVRDIVVILGEGNLPHPRCSLCNVLVLLRLLNGMHQRTYIDVGT